MGILAEIGKATRDGDQDETRRLTEQALSEGLGYEKIIQEGFVPAMDVVGDGFAAGTVYIPEMLIAARAMQAGMEVLKPSMQGQAKATSGKIVLGTVKGDLHDIGKNLVGMLMEGTGLEVIDVGVDVPVEQFIAAVEEHQPDYLGLSALLTTTIGEMEKVISGLKEKGLREKVKVLVGGAPVTQTYAEKIGADGFAENAGQAAKMVKSGQI